MEMPTTPKAPTNLLDKVKSVAGVVKSIFDNGFATPELQQRRLDVCVKTGGTYCDTCERYQYDGENSCKCDDPEWIEQGCSYLRDDANGLHCKQCGCGQAARATDIRMKAVAPKVACPRDIWPSD